MPWGVWPATGWKSASSSNRLGRATERPMVTTSFATAEAVRRWRKMRRSSTRPMNGANTNTDKIRAGTVPQPHSSRAWKYMAADTYAWAPKARLNTPDVLYVSTKPSAMRAYTAPGGVPCRIARKMSSGTDAARIMGPVLPPRQLKDVGVGSDQSWVSLGQHSHGSSAGP